MRYISKRNTEPKELTEFREGTPGVSYDDLGKNRKDVIRNSLLDEQGFICAYCMGRIHTDNCTIEHIVSQQRHEDSPYPETEHRRQSLLYSNMCGVCANDGQHCDKSRGNIPLLILDPHQSSCETLVTYDLNGLVKPSIHEINKVKKDIESLGLNCNSLVKNRRAVWDDVWKRFISNHKKEEWSKELFLRYAEEYRAKHRMKGGVMKYRAYCNFIAWGFEYYAQNYKHN